MPVNVLTLPSLAGLLIRRSLQSLPLPSWAQPQPFTPRPPIPLPPPTPFSAASPLTRPPTNPQALPRRRHRAGPQKQSRPQGSRGRRKDLQGRKNEALQKFLPTITLTGDTGVYQHNLAALGFGPGVSKSSARSFPAACPRRLLRDHPRHPHRRPDSLQPDALLRPGASPDGKAAGAAERAAYFAKMSARGEVVQQVATAYLHAIAAASEVDNAKALEAAGPGSARPRPRRAPGRNRRQSGRTARPRPASVPAAGAASPPKTPWKRTSSCSSARSASTPARRSLLTDPAPYSELAAQTPEEVRAIAYKSRQDYQNLQNQAVEYKAIHAAYRSQRLPTPQLRRLLRRQRGQRRRLPRQLCRRQGTLSFRSSAKPSCAATPKPPRPSSTPSTPSSPTCAPTSISRCAPLCSTSDAARKTRPGRPLQRRPRHPRPGR